MQGAAHRARRQYAAIDAKEGGARKAPPTDHDAGPLGALLALFFAASSKRAR
jgi:hypothetical protein